jgi:alkanesulfonate monooxygenase SsuD/methylene tetrahydromethanopterin reductase-like flavin-dependent oxidoreductase (luciferase family)
MAALAARTSTMRLLSCIFILPLHQPVAVAEQLAELDRISGGQLIFGAGTGYRDYEFAGHGIEIHTRARRMDEMLAIIRAGLEQIKLWERETGCDYLHLATSPYITTDEEFEAQKRFIRLFAKEVIPAL